MSGNNGDTSSRMLIYGPRCVICVLTCLWTLWKTVRVVRGNSVIYHNFVLLLLYIAINCKLLYTVASSALLIFEGEGNKSYKAILSATEATFTNVAVYVSLERMVFALQNTSDEDLPEGKDTPRSQVQTRHHIIPALKYSCWIMLCIQLVIQMFLSFYRSDASARNFFRAIDTFATFAFMSVVFLEFVYLMDKLAGVWVPTQAKTITAFFVSQMAGELGYSFYCIARIYFKTYIGAYDALGTVIFVYVLTLITDLAPSVLIVLILSGVGDDARSQSGSFVSAENLSGGIEGPKEVDTRSG